MGSETTGHEDSLAPPPSYEEAVNSPPVLPNRPPSDQYNQGNSLYGPNSPPQGPRPPPRPQPQSYSQHSQQQSHNNSQEHPTRLSYNNNPGLPLNYPRGFLCRKCKNTGYKIKNGRPCHSCWEEFFKNKAYNPNSSLPFRYPKNFICEKCRNTGLKLKNGMSCQDCYARFARPNRTSYSPMGTYIASPVPSQGPLAYSNPVVYSGPGPAQPYATPQRVLPGDPRMGGILCGRCRGTGVVTFLLDTDPCPLCHGVGRLFNTGQY